MNTTPVRLQRSRRKGARLVSPNGLPVVCVTRPGRFGNPFKVGEFDKATDRTIDAGMAVNQFRMMAMQFALPEFRAHLREKLGGKNLACYCALDRPCHADVLLIIANSTEAEIQDPDAEARRRLYAIGRSEVTA